MSDQPDTKLSVQDLKDLATCFYKLKPLFDAVLNEDSWTTCALESCGIRFPKREAKQRFCCTEHQKQWHNEQRGTKKVALAIADAPTVKCQVSGCENTFTLDMTRAFPYRCESCAAKSV